MPAKAGIHVFFLSGTSKVVDTRARPSAAPGMTIGEWLSLLLLLMPLTGCDLILGESFIEHEMRNPKTGAAELCVGHVGRGGASQAELDTMKACMAWYESQGYVRMD